MTIQIVGIDMNKLPAIQHLKQNWLWQIKY